MGLPAPPLPTLPVQDDASTDGSATDMQCPYPAIELFRTKEETLTKLAERKASMGVLPQSAVEKSWIRMQGTPSPS